MSSFAEIANKKASEIEKPPLPPIGPYVMQVTNQPAIQKRNSANGDFEVLDFQLQGVQHLDGVDVKELSKFGGAKGVRVRHSFIFNTSPDEEANFQRTEYNLKQFLVEHLRAGKETDTLAQLIGAAKGKTCVAEIGHRPDANKPDTFYADVKNTQAVA
jgi:hypothetical protein